MKEHKCGICGREFTLLANMKRHVLIHTNIRAYQCHLCYKSFVQKQTLKAHMIVHSDVKPFKCKVGSGPGVGGRCTPEGCRGLCQWPVEEDLQETSYCVSSEGLLWPTPGPSMALFLCAPHLCLHQPLAGP